MTKRQLLRSAVIVLLSIVLISFIWILFSGINTADLNAYHENDQPQHKLFNGLNDGQVVLRRYQGQTVWVLPLSASQQAQAQELSIYVMDETMTACKKDNAVCVLLAATQRTGINTHYTQQAPAQLAVDTPWYGGFVDPTNGTFYDFLGRPYKGQENQTSLKSVDVQ